MANMVTFHLHSDYSLLDSVTNYKNYIDRAVECGQKAIAFSEHGKPLGWVKKKMYCDERGIKYLHAVECYLTEQLEPKTRDNYHTILIAKNADGVKEINAAISKSCDEEHFYYVNRLSFAEFLQLSPNVITTSACLASPLNKLDTSHPSYEALVKRYDYLEIQPHQHPEQIAFNVHLACLAEQYHKPLIAGTDTHSLNQYKAECRKILQKRKHRSYGDEDAFDLTFKTREELEQAFAAQDALPAALWMQAIDNTESLADQVEDYALDTGLKYPVLYGSREADHQKLVETIQTKFQQKLSSGVIPPEQKDAFETALAEELDVFTKIQMDGFMLSMSELVSWCKDNGIAVGNARGSVGGSRVAYVTDVIDLNPETWHTVFSRFANVNRVEVGDIDVDVIEADRPRIFQYITERFGVEKTARVASFGTIADKGAIDDICGALREMYGEEHPDVSDDDNPYSLRKTDEVKKRFASSPDQTRTDRPDIFYYFDGLIGTKVSQSVHPAGMVISPITLADNYGVFDKDGDPCLMLDMDEVHDIGLVKYDFLILSNIEIIRDTYAMLGKPYPKSNEIDWDDQAVWKDMLRSPTGIFQMEGEYAFSLLRQYEPHSIFDMSLVTAAIRPSGASYREDLIKHKQHKNPSALIDNLLADNLGYLVYQEDIIQFLQVVCGLSGSEADTVRRGIARKKPEVLEEALPKILDGYCAKSTQPRDVAETEAREFLQIIDDASSYMFGYNHSIAYCLIGYLCAYLRYYHPYEFITSYLNHAATDADITNGTILAQEYGIRITPPKYGISKSHYAFDADRQVISKGLSSIKYLSAAAATALYDIAHTDAPGTFMELLQKISQHPSIDERQLDILLKIDFFSDFGNVAELARIRDIFSFFKNGNAKEMRKDKLTPELVELISPYATDHNAKGNELKSYTIVDMPGLLRSAEAKIRALHLPDIDLRVKMANQQEHLGYVDIVTGNSADRRKLLITEITPVKSKDNGEVWCYRLSTRSIGTGKTSRLSVKTLQFNKSPLNAGDIIYAHDLSKNQKGYWYLLRYEKII